MKNQYPHSHFSSSLLCGLLIALFLIFSCVNPLNSNFDPNLPIADADIYIVYGYVYRNDFPVVTKSVWMYIKDYQYQPSQTTFECKTDAQGFYAFRISYVEWNRYYYNLTCNLKQINGKITFGQVDRIDFEL